MNVGLIAGAGNLPRAVISGAQKSGHTICVGILDGIADPAHFQIPQKIVGLAEFGKIIKFFKSQKCSYVCLAGQVKRPDFSRLKPDMKAIKYLPGVLKAAKEGDDALLAAILTAFEKEGFEIVSAQELCREILLSNGPIGKASPEAVHRADIAKAMDTALRIGALDIGQAAIVCDGLVLAVEAQEGTDAMLRRVAQLNPAIRGRPDAPRGVLAKMVKPDQEDRVDLPTIGPNTVALAIEAGLAGIVAEPDRCFVLDRDAAIVAADNAGIFIAGVPRQA